MTLFYTKYIEKNSTVVKYSFFYHKQHTDTCRIIYTCLSLIYMYYIDVFIDRLVSHRQLQAVTVIITARLFNLL